MVFLCLQPGDLQQPFGSRATRFFSPTRNWQQTECSSHGRVQVHVYTEVRRFSVCLILMGTPCTACGCHTSISQGS